MQKIVAEFIGTYVLVLFGTGAVIVNDYTQGQVTHLGVSLVFGLVVMGIIFAFSRVSGAHINPAVSFAFYLNKNLTKVELISYVIAQFLGGIAASFTWRIFFSEGITFGATLPQIGDTPTFIMEFILTFILMLVVFMVGLGDAIQAKFAAIAIGGLVTIEALVCGPLTGASMNPARSLGPAIFSGTLEYTWIYCTAPILGAVAALPVWKYLLGGEVLD